MDDQPARPDARAAQIAARQHGVVTSGQLKAAGLTKQAIFDRVRKGSLHRVHRDVYAVGHRGLSREGEWMASILACNGYGRESFLSHSSAAVLWGLLPSADGPIEVVVRGYGGKTRREGLRVHRSETLGDQDVARRRGIPVTSPSRTLVDLDRAPQRWRLPKVRLRQAVRQAGVLGYNLGAVEWDRSRSELEALFLTLCRRRGLPMPEVNVRIGPLTVDFLWRAQRFVVETDGFRYHRGQVAFEDDRRRDLKLRALGFEVMRLTYAQVVDQSREVAATLASRLAQPDLAT